MMQHKKKISDQASACAQSGSIRRRAQLAGWFVNFQEFSQVDRNSQVDK